MPVLVVWDTLQQLEPRTLTDGPYTEAQDGWPWCVRALYQWLLKDRPGTPRARWGGSPAKEESLFLSNTNTECILNYFDHVFQALSVIKHIKV